MVFRFSGFSGQLMVVFSVCLLVLGVGFPCLVSRVGLWIWFPCGVGIISELCACFFCKRFGLAEFAGFGVLCGFVCDFGLLCLGVVYFVVFWSILLDFGQFCLAFGWLAGLLSFGLFRVFLVFWVIGDGGFRVCFTCS